MTCMPYSGFHPSINMAGIVKITPAASDSPAEPIVCDMFVSSGEPLRAPSTLCIKAKMATDITETGIEADIVNPEINPT